MKLNYPHPPEVGTIVYYKQDEPDSMERFYAIAAAGHTLRVADARDEIYVLAQSHTHAPRSVMEHYILRRVWTAYGYAKVWGQTPPIEPPKPSADELRIRWFMQEERAVKQETMQQRCAAWWTTRRPAPAERPRGRDYMKKVNELYYQMARDIDAGN